MQLIEIIIATTLVSLISLFGIFLVYKKIHAESHAIKMIISLAAGSLLAVTFLDLLPEAIEGYDEPKHIFITVLISFLIFFILEKYWHWHHCRCIDHGTHKNQAKKSIIFANLVGDGIHNLADGFLIAAAFMLDLRTGIIATLVVIIHEIPQEISDFGVLIFGGLSKTKAILYNLLFALTSIVGGIAFYFLGKNFEFLIPFMGAFAAGNFLYLATADLIPELHHEKNPHRVLLHTIWLLLGVAIILTINLSFPEIHT